jgi:hypothetical protein
MPSEASAGQRLSGLDPREAVVPRSWDHRPSRSPCPEPVAQLVAPGGQKGPKESGPCPPSQSAASRTTRQVRPNAPGPSARSRPDRRGYGPAHHADVPRPRPVPISPIRARRAASIRLPVTGPWSQTRTSWRHAQCAQAWRPPQPPRPRFRAAAGDPPSPPRPAARRQARCRRAVESPPPESATPMVSCAGSRSRISPTSRSPSTGTRNPASPRSPASRRCCRDSGCRPRPGHAGLGHLTQRAQPFAQFQQGIRGKRAFRAAENASR